MRRRWRCGVRLSACRRPSGRRASELVLTFLIGLLVSPAFAADHWTTAEEEDFLQSAKITSEEPVGKGIKHSRKAILTAGSREHAAQIQTVDIYTPLFKGADGSQETEFKDSWKFNVAAYRLAKLLHVTNMVPVAVARVVDGKPAALSWWIDDVAMDEKERLAKKAEPPNPSRWNDQMDTIRTFDQLIYNMDRSQENILIAKNWDVWMIDHTRAFRKWAVLRNPAMIAHCNPELLRALKDLPRSAVERELGPYLTQDEISGLMARRDIIVDMLITHSGN
jgi:hypothetical protein